MARNPAPLNPAPLNPAVSAAALNPAVSITAVSITAVSITALHPLALLTSTFKSLSKAGAKTRHGVKILTATKGLGLGFRV